MSKLYEEEVLDTTEENVDITEKNVDSDENPEENLIKEINNELDCEEKEEEEKKRCFWGRPVDLSANCALELHVEPENKMIYVCPGKAQYFLATSSKACGPINVKYLGNHCCYPPVGKCKKVWGYLGYYYILDSGIVFIPKKHLCAGCIDVLPFLAYDGCNHYKFEVVFTYSPCECCCCCCNK